MRLLLDTNALIWVAFDPARIPQTKLNLIQNPDNEIAYSIAALWEISIKNGTRRSLEIEPISFRRRLQNNKFQELPILADHTLAIGQLPRLHGDPFDRILIAQAIVEDYVLVTSDKLILQYPSVRTLAI